MSFRGIVRDVRDGFGSLSRRSFGVRFSGPNRGKSQGSVCELYDEAPVVQRSRWASLPPELLRDVIKRLEASESTQPSRKHVVACAAVCRSWREMCKEIVRNPELSGKLTFPPGPRDGTIECFIKRDKSTLLISTCVLALGRVTVASVKNFQLIAATQQPAARAPTPSSQPAAPAPPDHDKIILQFGKVAKDMFTMDYRYPKVGIPSFCYLLGQL